MPPITIPPDKTPAKIIPPKLLFLIKNWTVSVVIFWVLKSIVSYLFYATGTTIILGLILDIAGMVFIMNSPILYLWLKYKLLHEYGVETDGKLQETKAHLAPPGARYRGSRYNTYKYTFTYENNEINARETDFFVYDSDIGTRGTSNFKVTCLREHPGLSTVFNPAGWLKKKTKNTIIVSIIITASTFFLAYPLYSSFIK